MLLLLLLRSRPGARELAEARESVGRGRLRLCGIRNGVVRSVGLAGRQERLETILPVAIGADESIVFWIDVAC